MDSRLRDLERRSATGTVTPQELRQAQIRAGQRLPWEDWPTLRLCYALVEKLGHDSSPNLREYNDEHVYIRWEHNAGRYGRRDCLEPRMTAVWRPTGECEQLASQVGTNYGWGAENEGFRRHALNLLAEREEEEREEEE